MYQPIQSLTDGTYLLLSTNDAGLVEVIRLDIDHGYWVATSSLRERRLIPNLVIGVWTGSEVHLDESMWFPSKSVALQAGKACNQISIWDCANNRAIFL